MARSKLFIYSSKSFDITIMAVLTSSHTCLVVLETPAVLLQFREATNQQQNTLEPC